VNPVEMYRRFGFATPLPLWSAETATAWRQRLEALEAETIAAHGGIWNDRDYRPWEATEHPFRQFGIDVATDQAVIDQCMAFLGPNLLIRNVDVFIKEPGSTIRIGWHLDSHVGGPNALKLLTLWIALSPTPKESGALRFRPGTHLADYPGAPQDLQHLSLRQEALDALKGVPVVASPLSPGQASAHCFRTVHGSPGNRTADRRVGLVVRAMAADCPAEVACAGAAMLVAGKNLGGFSLRDDVPMTWRVA